MRFSFLNFTDENDNNPSFINMTRNILTLMMIGSVALLPLVSGVLGSPDWIAFTLLSITILLEGISLYLVTKGSPAMAKLVVPLSLIITIAFTAASDNGLRDTSLIGLPIILIIAALLLGKQSMWVVSPLLIIAVMIIAIIDTGNDKPVQQGGWAQAGIITVLVFMSSAVLQHLVNRLHESIAQARENEQIQITKNAEMENLRLSLEERINQRTAELDNANHHNLRRARQFETISQIARVISTIQDLDTLLPYITQVISEQLGVYHTAIFLVDEERDFVVLHAASSDQGRRMLMSGYKTRIGSSDILGIVTATGQPRISNAEDISQRENKSLINSQSEITLPLRYAGVVTGALDVHSSEPAAFDQEDIEILTILADQVSITITNTLALEKLRAELAEFQKSVGENIRESWKIMRPKALGLGFQLRESVVKPIETPITGEHIQDALAQNKTILINQKNAPSALAIPVRLRGKNIGFINVSAKNNYQLTSDDAEIVEAITERLGLAIETATLLQTTRHRADIERVTTDISTRISSSSNFDTILQTAAQELSRALGGSDVIVQIEPASITDTMS
jgi:GAF domain-containing protein